MRWPWDLIFSGIRWRTSKFIRDWKILSEKSKKFWVKARNIGLKMRSSDTVFLPKYHARNTYRRFFKQSNFLKMGWPWDLIFSRIRWRTRKFIRDWKILSEKAKKLWEKPEILDPKSDRVTLIFLPKYHTAYRRFL